MRIDVNSPVKKLALLIPLWVLSVFVGATVLRRFLAEAYLTGVPDRQSLQKAIAWNGGNSLYHYYLGRLYHYGLEPPDLPRAIAAYRHALALSPLVAGYWLDLGRAYEEAQQPAEAGRAFSQAARLNARSPQVRWEVANFWLRRGDLDQAFTHLRAVAQFNENRLSQVMSLCWKLTPDHERVLRQVIPDTAFANLSFLNFVLEKKDYTLAACAWARFQANDAPGFQAERAFPYIDALVAQGEISQARRVWSQMMTKCGFADAPAERPAGGNLIFNGSFETEALNGGFDWRTPPGLGFALIWDSEDRLTDYRSLRIDFDGRANVDFFHLYQIVPLRAELPAPPRPRSLIFSYAVKTEEVSTDQGVFWEIVGYPFQQGVLARSRPHLGTTPWTRGLLEFSVDAGVQSLMIRLRRLPSQKLDNRLKGRVWLDDVALREAPPAGAHQG